MKVFVAGAAGKTGRLIVEQLVKNSHEVTGLVRKEKQADQVAQMGATSVVKDINDDLKGELAGFDAAVFAAAGSMGHYQQVDHEGVRNLAGACEANNVNRFVLVSALGAHDPGSWGIAYKPYLQGKADGEEALKNTRLKWTIIRPGSLNNGTAQGKVTLNQQVGGMGNIARADVAGVAVACLTDNHSIGKTFELYEGSEPVAEAITNL